MRTMASEGKQHKDTMWVAKTSVGVVGGLNNETRCRMALNSLQREASVDWINRKLDDDILMLVLQRVGDKEGDAGWPLVCRRWLRLEGHLRKSVRLMQVKGMGRLLSRFAAIEVVDLSRCHNLTDEMLLPILDRYGRCLRRVDLSGCKGITEGSIGRVFENCPQLVEFKAARCTSVVDIGLSTLRRCLNLQVLDLSFCWKLADQGLYLIASGSTLLVDLSLRWCQAITDAGLSVLARGCSLLHSLDISYTEVTNASMEAVAGLKNLKSLLMVCCKNVSDDGIECLKHGCPILEKLDISGCVSVGNAGISALADSAIPLRQLIARRTPISAAAVTTLAKFESLTVLRLGQIAITVPGLTSIGNSCQGLRDFGLWRCTGVVDEGMLAVVKGCTQLQRLDLTCCDDLTDDTLFAISRFCRSLVSLEMEACSAITAEGVAALTASCTALEEIDFSDCDITDEGASAVAKCRELKKLKMGLCPKLTDAGLENIGKCSLLREVELYRLERVGDKGISAVVLGAPLLTRLNISYCTNITDASLQAIGTCRALINLEIRGCGNVTSEGLAMVASGCKNLEELDLKRCVGVGDRGIIALADCCPRLRQLNLSYCRMRDEGMMSLVRLNLLENMKLMHLPNISIGCFVHVVLGCQQLKKLKLLTTYRAGIPAAVIEQLESRFCKLRWMTKPENPNMA